MSSKLFKQRRSPLEFLGFRSTKRTRIPCFSSNNAFGDSCETRTQAEKSALISSSSACPLGFVFRRMGIFLIGGVLLFCSCQGSRQQMYKPSTNDPYLENAPQDAQEEAYYQDVYSGGWKEQTNPFGMGKSIVKQTGSSSAPGHWSMIPHGAVPMSQIRHEASLRKNQNRINPQAPPVEYSDNRPEGNAVPPGQMSNATNANPSQYPASQYPAAPSTQTLAPSLSNKGSASGSSALPESPLGNNILKDGFSEMRAFAKTSNLTSNWVIRAQAPQDEQEIPLNASPAPASETDGNLPQDSAALDSAANDSAAPEPSNREASTQNDENSFAPVGEMVELSADNIHPLPPTSVNGVLPNRSTSADVLETNSPQKNASPLEANQVHIIQQDTNTLNTQSFERTERAMTLDPSLNDQWSQNVRPEEAAQSTTTSEFIVTGQDHKGEVYSLPDWSVHHLDTGDTVAHFDTLDGQILVEPSNEIQIYSPRFGTVRQVIGSITGEFELMVQNAESKIGTEQKENSQGIDVRSQDVKTNLARNNLKITGTESRSILQSVSDEAGVMEVEDEIRLNNMVSLLRSKSFKNDQWAQLTEGALAAANWGEVQGVKVALDQISAQANVYNEGAESVYVVEDGTKTSKLRLVRIASKDSARPGELIEFTMRFENIGNQPIGNVTILDSLNARLAYVDTSAKSSVPANFLTQQNDEGTLVLRWEIIDPLEPGEFGVVQFLVKVL